jgi:hypothetical protein
MDDRHSELPCQPGREARLPASVRTVDHNQQRPTLGRQRLLDTFKEFI